MSLLIGELFTQDDYHYLNCVMELTINEHFSPRLCPKHLHGAIPSRPPQPCQSGKHWSYLHFSDEKMGTRAVKWLSQGCRADSRQNQNLNSRILALGSRLLLYHVIFQWKQSWGYLGQLLKQSQY